MNILAIGSLIVSLLGQGAPQLGPVAPWGSDAVFQQTMLDAEKAMYAGDFAKARVLAERLPKVEFAMQWDEKSIPPEQRAAFAAARDRAIAIWKEVVFGLKVNVGNRGDVKITFLNELPPNADSPGKAGAVTFESDDPQDPRIEHVIALKRTDEGVPTTARDVRNEVGFAIARYLGLERTFRRGSMTDRTEESYRVDNIVLPIQAALVKQNVAVRTELLKLINAKTRVTPASPELYMEPMELTRASVVQGDQPNFTIQITNRGNAPLAVHVVPDCSCFSLMGPDKLEAGQTGVIRVTVDTRDFPGDLKKMLFLYTNDGERKLTKIPVHFRVKPRFRLIRADQAPVVVIGEAGLKLEYYLYSENPELDIASTSLSGVSGVIETAPWTGTLADPEMGEGPMPRKGTKITILANPTQVAGRGFGTLIVKTSNPKWSTLMAGFSFQFGIAALPANAYFGDLGKDQASTLITLSRPGQPFKIRKITFSHACFIANITKGKTDDEYVIEVRYNGKGELGDLDGTMTVETDDPKQPKVFVPVTGVVR